MSSISGGVGQIAGGIMANAQAKSDANSTKRLGKAEEEDLNRSNRRILGAQRVAFARAGVATGTGSALDVLGDSVAEARLQELRVRFRRDTEAAVLKRKGQEAMIQGISSGVGSILSGVASAGLAG